MRKDVFNLVFYPQCSPADYIVKDVVTNLENQRALNVFKPAQREQVEVGDQRSWDSVRTGSRRM